MVGRVEEGEVEGGAGAGRAGAKVGRVTAVDARLTKEAKSLDIVADRAPRLIVGLHEETKGRASG